MRGLIVMVLLLSGCSLGGQMRLESPFKMSDEELAQKVSALVNPSLQQLQARHDELKAEIHEKLPK